MVLTTENAFFFFYLILDVKNTNVVVKLINIGDLNHKVMFIISCITGSVFVFVVEIMGLP